jgi:hypothetical protein
MRLKSIPTIPHDRLPLTLTQSQHIDISQYLLSPLLVLVGSLSFGFDMVFFDFFTFPEEFSEEISSEGLTIGSESSILSLGRTPAVCLVRVAKFEFSSSKEELPGLPVSLPVFIF